MNELTMLLNEYAKSYHGDSEKIEEEDIIKALYYIDNLYINSEVDVLIYLAALNLCNSYAKGLKEHDIYRFKKGIGTIINILNSKDIDNVKACMTNDKGNLYIFEIRNMQFSFHDEKKINISDKYYKEMTWDGIRKQPCSKTIFNNIIDSSIAYRSITTTGKPIKMLVNKLIDDFHRKILTFDEIIDNI